MNVLHFIYLILHSIKSVNRVGITFTRVENNLFMKRVINSLRIALFLNLLLFIHSCSGEQKDGVMSHKFMAEAKEEIGKLAPFQVDTSFQFISSIRVIFEDSNGNIWIGTENEGICKYDGRLYTHFYEVEGKQINPILDIQEDRDGNIWIKTRKGLSRFNGKTFQKIEPKEVGHSQSNWKLGKNDLWFQAGTNGDVFQFDGMNLNRLFLPDFKSPNKVDAHITNPNWVFSSLKDRVGNLWFGTISAGVLHFDGAEFHQIVSPELAHTVNAIFEDSNGSLWFANNGGGVFLYENAMLSNLTEKHGLGNEGFMKSGILNFQKGTLARVFAIEEDAAGGIWFGTIDSGLWKYKNGSFTNYTIEDGAAGNDVRSIKRDSKGTLWIGFGNGGLCTFDGKTFKLINANEPNGC